MKLESAKGMRDFMPEDQILVERIIDIIKNIFKKYGYQPLNTPALERYDVIAAKYAGGSELLKETFILEDQGKRKLALRNEFTVPLARIIATRRDLKFPFKRYQIGPIWRDGPVEKNRYREFIQCDVDIVGCKNMKADAELMLMTDQIFKTLGLKYEILLNNRKVLNALIGYTGIDKSKAEDAILVLDKIEKIGREKVEEEMIEKGVLKKDAVKLLDVIGSLEGKKNEKILDGLDGLGKKEKSTWTEMLKEGINELREILEYTKKSDINIRICPSLARGLGYYTGPIFEAVLIGSGVKVSVAGGGRWDEMIGKYIGKNREYPATGISFGVNRIFDELKKKQESKTTTQIFIIPINPEKTFKKSLGIAQKLRQKGINVDIDLMGRGISKNLNYVNTADIPFAIFIGETELKEKKLKIKDMKSGKEEVLSLEKIIEKIKKTGGR